MTSDEKKPGETAREYAYRVLREAIVSLELEPGAALNDVEFSKKIGISRTPVREAVISLSEESRIIEIFPQRGMRVALIDTALVEEARFLRQLLEKAVIELDCDAASEEALKQLEENVGLQEFYLSQGSSDKLLELDNEFHRSLFAICHKEMTYNLCRKLGIHYDRIRSMEVHTAKDLNIVGEHRSLVEAVRGKDKKLAVELMEKHLNQWQMKEGVLREKYAGYFKE